ncbi:hypothetical protein N7495_002694 [Penicillium taxi]|uniref:uncharacterized protein n=1 Tax=Penicillium taxi TaxID=168475 RepID=UPI002545606A|nr:uncharacterized protein N7495_002694 [Penicillium taxi]KAJ5902166.1 hypothetical protein N7495_002694 [Penicillium taxi]
MVDLMESESNHHQLMDQATEKPVKKLTRHSKACRRCRRLRSKCINSGDGSKCEACRLSNHDCIFLARGQKTYDDREFRRPRVRSSNTSVKGKTGPASTSPSAHPDAGFQSSESSGPGLSVQGLLTPGISDPWDSLPPFEELFIGINTFTKSFFQLGFLPKTLFFERLRKQPDTVSVFLLFSILSISARFTPSLVNRYGGGSSATKLYLTRAAALIPEQMFRPSLEATQGFFLLSIAEWGNGDKNRSSMYMGIAVTMAGILRLHREETYNLPEDATAEQFVNAEAARRTFWMLESYNNLLSGLSSPVAISYNDISALLPCSEPEFSFGALTGPRAALLGTIPALKDPSLAHSQSRSLFATLLQTHNLWGQIARTVGTDADLQAPEESRMSRNDYTRLLDALNQFEINIPIPHRWSVWNLRGFKSEGLDLAFLSVVMVLRLSNIVLRRRYLHDKSISQEGYPQDTGHVTTELFENMLILHEQIDAFFDFRSPEQGFPALIVFCVYVCGSLANHLHQKPSVCPSIAPQAEEILRKSLTGLGQLQHAWPLARRWNKALCRASARIRTQSQDETSPSVGFSPSTELIVSELQPSPGAIPRLNDPFPTDVMLAEFETYPWSDIFTDLINNEYSM